MQMTGFSGADITALVREATTQALRRERGRLEELARLTLDTDRRLEVTKDDFEQAFRKVSFLIIMKRDL